MVQTRSASWVFPKTRRLVPISPAPLLNRARAALVPEHYRTKHLTILESGKETLAPRPSAERIQTGVGGFASRKTKIRRAPTWEGGHAAFRGAGSDRNCSFSLLKKTNFGAPHPPPTHLTPIFGKCLPQFSWSQILASLAMVFPMMHGRKPFLPPRSCTTILGAGSGRQHPKSLRVSSSLN